MNKPLFIQRLPIYLIVYWSIIIVSLASIIEDKELPTDNNDKVEEARMGINLTSLSDGPYEMDSGQSVTWTVLIDILLDAVTEEDHLSVRWSIADNEIISNSTSPIKYQTVTEHNQTSLTVRNLSSNDTAVYHLTVSLGNHKQSLSFTLKIRDDPSYFMVNYSLTDSISIVCWVYSQPPIMGLSFGQEQLILKRHVWKEVFHFDSRKNIHQQPVTVYVKEPRPLGNKTDDGSNSNKRTGASTTARRYQNKNSIEQFQLSCTSSPVATNGSSFVPRDVQWSWTMSNGTGLQFNASQPLYGLKMHSLPCMMMIFGRRSCTGASIQMLMWRNVSTATEGFYTVAAPHSTDDITASVDHPATRSLSFIIRGGREPVIYNSSDSVVTVSSSSSTESDYQIVTLFCDAYGLPPPSSQWLQNGIPLTLNADEELNDTNETVQGPTVISIQSTETGTLLNLNISSSVTAGMSSNDPERLDLFTCRFENAAGRAEKSIALMIHQTHLEEQEEDGQSITTEPSSSLLLSL